MFSLDGQEVPQMDVYIIIHAHTAFQFLWEHTLWLMPGFQHLLVSLYLSNKHIITSKSGPEHLKCLSCVFVHIILADGYLKVTKYL
jgi:hypothetical protein